MDIAAFPATDMHATALLVNIALTGFAGFRACGARCTSLHHPDASSSAPDAVRRSEIVAKPHARSLTVVGDEDDARSFHGAADGGQVCGIDRVFELQTPHRCDHDMSGFAHVGNSPL
jgi:hypothetical protein